MAKLVGTRPAPRAPRPFRFPPFERTRLDNGMHVIACQVPGRQLASASLLLEAGIAFEPADRAGVAALAARALTVGTERYDETAFVDEGERLGADIGANTDWDGFTIDARVPVSRLEPALELLAEAALRATFPEAEVGRLREERLNDIRQEMANPSSRAMLAFGPAAYAPGSTYGRPGAGTVESVSALTADALSSYYRAHASPGSATLVVAGDLEGLDVPSIAERLFGGWNAPEPERAKPRVEDGVSETAITLVHRPGAVQSNVVMGHIGIPRSSPDFFAVRLMVEVLGGSFNSRINLKLREEKGYTYGAHAFVDYRRWPGPFASAAPVQTGVTREAVEEMLAEIRRMHEDGPTQAELDEARDYLVGVFPLRFETPDAIAGGIAALVTYEHEDDWFDRYGERLRAVSLEDAATAARTLLRPDRIAIVVVGDAEQIEEPLRASGLGPVEVVTDES